MLPCRIIFSLEGIGSECTKEQVEAQFGKWAVEVRIRGYKKLDYIFAIKHLCGEVLPEQCKFILKTNTLTLVLVKKENKHWGQLPFKEEKVRGG